MSVYRKDEQGNLVKIAGSLTQRVVMPILRTTHIVEDNADYYIIDDAQAASYLSGLTDNTYYLLYIEEANETSTVYIKYKNQQLQLSTGTNTTITPDTLYGRLDLLTLDASKSGIIINAATASTGGGTSDNIAEALLLGMDGVVEEKRVIFDVQNAASFIRYKTNQRRFILNGLLPVVGQLDLTMPVHITFGDTVYNVYSFAKGGDEPLMIGDLIGNHSYNTETGYQFTIEALFIDTTDIKGFVLSPSPVLADQLLNTIDDSETIIVSLDSTGSKVQLHLAASINNKLARMLVTPMTKPGSTELVAVGSDGMQTMLELGDGLSIVNGKLVASGGGSADLSQINALLDAINGEVI
jgi:hypothetical protein